MTRKEFLQIVGGSLVVLFGIANFIKVLDHYTKPADKKETTVAEASHGFGSRKFGA